MAAPRDGHRGAGGGGVTGGARVAGAGHPRGLRPARPVTLEEAAGLPAPLAAWLENGTPPADAELLDVQETP
jgi:hypothetical protein